MESTAHNVKVFQQGYGKRSTDRTDHIKHGYNYHDISYSSFFFLVVHDHRRDRDGVLLANAS